MLPAHSPTPHQRPANARRSLLLHLLVPLPAGMHCGAMGCGLMASRCSTVRCCTLQQISMLCCCRLLPGGLVLSLPCLAMSNERCWRFCTHGSAVEISAGAVGGKKKLNSTACIGSGVLLWEMRPSVGRTRRCSYTQYITGLNHHQPEMDTMSQEFHSTHLFQAAENI